MKTILRAILGVTMAVSPLLAGQEPTEKEKQKQDEPRKQPPPNQQQEPQPPEKPKPKPEKPQPESATPPKQQKPNAKQQQQQEQDEQKQEKEEEKKSKDSKQQQGQTGYSRTQQSPQASHGKGERIPSEKFQSNFGSQHYFQVQDLQDGRRFQHAGYWFEIVEVWPADWSYHDLCYIGEDAGEYYIGDLYHPGVRVSVIVVGG